MHFWKCFDSHLRAFRLFIESSKTTELILGQRLQKLWKVSHLKKKERPNSKCNIINFESDFFILTKLKQNYDLWLYWKRLEWLRILTILIIIPIRKERPVLNRKSTIHYLQLPLQRPELAHLESLGIENLKKRKSISFSHNFGQILGKL